MPPPRGSFNPLEGPGDYDVTSSIHSDTYPYISPLNLDLRGKSALVTGGSRGIGRAAVLSLARAGVSRIAVGARSDLSALAAEVAAAAKEADRPAPEFLPLKLDMADAASVDAAVQKIATAFDGRLDIVLNVAGVFGTLAKVADSDPAAWSDVLTTNVVGAYNVCRASLPLVLRGELRTIINVASVGAHLVTPGVSAYQISKVALLRLSEFVVAEQQQQSPTGDGAQQPDRGVVCFSVHPGNVMTDMTKNVNDALRHIFVDSPELAADTMVHLASERRDWLAGRYVNVTWDMPELLSKKDVIVNEDLLKVRLKLGSLVS